MRDRSREEGSTAGERGEEEIIVKITYGPTSSMHAEEESFAGRGGEEIARYSLSLFLLSSFLPFSLDF